MEQARPLLVLLNEGTRGHSAQSRGICAALRRLADVETIELDIPSLKGLQKIKYLKLMAGRLPKVPKPLAEKWLTDAGGDYLHSQVSAALGGEKRPLLFISAGSSAAPYCLALAHVFGGKSCVIMVPSVLGVKPFDMAIVPKHDACTGDNVLVTLGAPNSISADLLEEQKSELLADYPPKRVDAWAILIGGDDQNYTIAPLWVNKVMPTLLDAAEGADADLYITTSRRTSASAEEALARACVGNPRVRMLLLASQDSRNPVPGMLGHCSKVFCTEDSVSMISESVTAGAQVAVVTVGHRHGVKRLLQEMTEYGVDAKILPLSCLWGVPRFNRMIEDFENQGCLSVITPRNMLDDLTRFLERPKNCLMPFNEAERAAAWIVSRWLA